MSRTFVQVVLIKRFQFFFFYLTLVYFFFYLFKLFHIPSEDSTVKFLVAVTLSSALTLRIFILQCRESKVARNKRRGFYFIYFFLLSNLMPEFSISTEIPLLKSLWPFVNISLDTKWIVVNFNISSINSIIIFYQYFMVQHKIFLRLNNNKFI